MTFTASALVLAWVAIVLLALGLAGLLRQVSLLTRQLESAGAVAPGGPGGAAPGRAGTGARGARTTRELVGFTAPADVLARLRPDGPGGPGHGTDGAGSGAGPGPGRAGTVVAFVAPGCSSCSITLRSLAADPLLAGGDPVDGSAHVDGTPGALDPARTDLPGVAIGPARGDRPAGALALTVVSTGSCEPALTDAAGATRLSCVPQGRDLLDRLAVPATPYLVALDPAGTVLAALLPDEDTDLGAWLRQLGTHGQHDALTLEPIKESTR